MASLSLQATEHRRAAPLPEGARGPAFDAAFDATTLWYDAVTLGRRLHLVCPKLANLAPLLAHLRVDGDKPRLRRKSHRRHDIVTTRAGALSLALGGHHWQTTPSPDQRHLFQGLRASLHISKNNDLDWIRDWARFHISAHGLEAMLVMDNGSDAYAPEQILDALQGLGLRRAVVLKVPQPYGPPRTKAHPGTAKYLQPAMLNLARLRFLRKARAVLNADLDELVWSRAGSVFDAALADPLGLVSFAGVWRQPPPRTAPPFLHAQHVHERKGHWPCPTKYCIRPGGPLGRLGWDVHRPETWLPVGLRPRADMGYWHCRGITTDWKGYGRLSPGNIGPRDASTAAVLERALGTCALAGPGRA